MWRTKSSKKTGVSTTNTDAQAHAKFDDISHDHDYTSSVRNGSVIPETGAASCSDSAGHGMYSQKDSPRGLKRKVSSVQRRLLSCRKKLGL